MDRHVGVSSGASDLIVEDIDVELNTQRSEDLPRMSPMIAPVRASSHAPSQGTRASRRMSEKHSGNLSFNSSSNIIKITKPNEVWTDVIPDNSGHSSEVVPIGHADRVDSQKSLAESQASSVPKAPETSVSRKKMPRITQAGEERKLTLGKSGLRDNKPVFADVAAMKQKLREAILKPKYNVCDYYKKDGMFQWIARHNNFEFLTLLIIAFNALWMAIDAEYNHEDLLSDAHVVFQVAEHFFCAYFLGEWFVRFMAFEVKADGMKDNWFVFDSALMLLTVIETWVLSALMSMIASDDVSSILPAPLLRLLRLLRLMRMARMAKLLKTMPELMILIKGMSMATRSVFFTCCLLVILIYVFAIAFTQLLRNTTTGDEHFNGVAASMITLALYGTLLDEITFVAEKVGQESMLCSILLAIFILMAALTVMNMLIGVLCEVVNAVAAVERDEMVVGRLHDQLRVLFDEQGLDMNGDGQISRSEFEKILEIPQAARALQDVGVDVVGLVDFAEVIFEGDPNGEEPERQLSFSAFMDVVLQLRGGNTATVKDVVDCRKSIMQHNERLVDNLYASIVDYHTDPTLETSLVPSSGMPKGIKASMQDANYASTSQTSNKMDFATSRAAPDAISVPETMSAITLNVPREHEDTGGTKDLRTVEDLLTNGLQEIQRIQAKSFNLEESVSAALNELRDVRRRTEGLQDVFVRGLNEVRRAQ